MKLIPNLSEIDRQTVLQTGMTAEQLMENAGSQAALTIQQLTEKHQQGVILCGPGNNGGDGFVIARKLYEAGYSELSVIYCGTRYQGEALGNLEKLMLHLPMQLYQAEKQTGLALTRIQEADFIVDALFGSGLSRAVSGVEARLVAASNQRRPAMSGPVVAVDMPSGVNGATGQVLGMAVQASHTITFAASKPGLHLYPGKGLAGQVSVAEIGIPQRLLDEDDSPAQLIENKQALNWLPERKADSHKYHYGHLLVIAGSETMPGAAVLTSEAATHAGAGLVTLAAPQSVFRQTSLSPEIMRLHLPDERHLGAQSVAAIQAAFERKQYHAVVIGPGLGQAPETVSAFHSLVEWLKGLEIPVIIDADGLNALSKSPIRLSEQFMLTPHTGECARLLNTESTAVSSDLLAAAQQASSHFQATVVLKAPATVIATPEPERRLWISPTGNAGMATAGSGDVLSGIIGALAAQRQAQGQATWQAGPLGVYLHGLAGDAAALNLTPYAMRASSITQHLPQAFQILLEQTLPDGFTAPSALKILNPPGVKLG